MTWHAELRTEVEQMFHALSVPDIWSTRYAHVESNADEMRAYWRDYRREVRRKALAGGPTEFAKRRQALTAKILELRAGGLSLEKIAKVVGRSTGLVRLTIKNPMMGLRPTGPRAARGQR